MERFWKKKTERARKTSIEIKSALDENKHGMSIREVANLRRFSKSSLQRYWATRKKFNTVGDFQSDRNFAHKQVFNKEQEMLLENYFIKSSEIFYGLTKQQASEESYLSVILFLRPGIKRKSLEGNGLIVLCQGIKNSF
ncbi:hypothetical protein QE152_g8035 [Popillia japonica]|uniref:Transposase n=1 Tax=Popillia japonica TaxID=7064 RepID=A0AAW1MCE5_POPJA